MMTDTKQVDDDRFFFAGDDAGSYDDTTCLVNPFYRQLHEVMQYLVDCHLSNYNEAGVVVDVGSGTGAEILPTLTNHKRMQGVAVDVSHEMNAILREKAQRVRVADRLLVVERDWLTLDSGQLKRALKEAGIRERIVVVLSALTMHHFSNIEKQKSHELAYELLPKGGLFVNGDLFTHLSPALSKMALDTEVAAIRRSFHDARRRSGSTRLRQRMTRLGEQWVRHYQQDNRCSPIGPQRDTLKQIGFSQIGCPYRVWQVGILWAIK